MAEPEATPPAAQPPTDLPTAQPAIPPSDQSTYPPAGQPVTAHADQPTTAPADQPTTPPTDQPVLKNEEKQLKYLDFVQVAAIYMVLCCSTVYEYTKENSGPLKPGVEIVEGTVKTVIGPVYEKFQNVPSDLLKFVDRKVGESLNELEHHVPALLKQLSRRAWSVAHKAPLVARELTLEVQQDGLMDTISNIAKSVYDEYEPRARELYIKYEPTAEQYAMTAWRTLNGLPLFAQAAHIMVPTAAYWAEKYNQSVAYAGEKGYTMSYYLPLVPIERIAKIFGVENESPVSRNGEFAALS